LCARTLPLDLFAGLTDDHAMSQPPLPDGLQQLLARAAVDRSLKDALLARRAEVAEAAGIALNPSEQAILASVPAAQLAQMIDELARVAPQPPPAYVVDDATRGIRPDLPPPVPAGVRPDLPAQGIRPDVPGPSPHGIRPDVQPAGIRPDVPPVSRGHSAKLPLVIGGTVLVGGAIAVGTMTAGISPDVPPARVTAPRPDAAPSPASQPAGERPPDAGTPPAKR
jgi:hypothetical protein